MSQVYNPTPYALGLGGLAQRGVESGFSFAQNDARIAMQEEEQRREAERYAVQHDADARFYEGLQRAFQEQAAEQQAAAAAMQQAGAQQADQASKGPEQAQPRPSGGMGPPTDAASQGPTGPSPQERLTVPGQAVQTAVAQGAPGAQDSPLAAAAGTGMGPSATEAARPGEPPSVPQGGPRIPPRDSFGQRLLKHVGPTTLAHMSPRAQEVAEAVFTEQAQYMARQQREAQDYQEMMRAGVFGYYLGGDPENPESLEALVDNLDSKVKMGLINEADIARFASPQLQEAYSRRLNANMEMQIRFLSYRRDENGQATFDPNVGPALRTLGPRTVAQIFAHEFPHELDMAAKGEEIRLRGEQARLTNDRKAEDARRLQEQKDAATRERLDKTLSAKEREQLNRNEQIRERLDHSRRAIELREKQFEHDLEKPLPMAQDPEVQVAKATYEQARDHIKDLDSSLDNLYGLRKGTYDKKQIAELDDKIKALEDARTKAKDLMSEAADAYNAAIRSRGETKKPEGKASPTPRPPKAGNALPRDKPTGKHPDPAKVVVPPDRVEAVRQRIREAVAALRAEGIEPTDDAVGDWLDKNPSPS